MAVVFKFNSVDEFVEVVNYRFDFSLDHRKRASVIGRRTGDGWAFVYGIGNPVSVRIKRTTRRIYLDSLRCARTIVCEITNPVIVAVRAFQGLGASGNQFL